MDFRLRSFIATSFTSVWSLELLLQLIADPQRAFTASELVTLLRASDSVVTRSVEALVTAGLAVAEAEERYRYAPASADLEVMAQATAAMYKSRPDAVRRLIAERTAGELSAFADAFKLRRDKR
jgi:predicted transcriptional regulator